MDTDNNAHRACTRCHKREPSLCVACAPEGQHEFFDLDDSDILGPPIDFGMGNFPFLVEDDDDTPIVRDHRVCVVIGNDELEFVVNPLDTIATLLDRALELRDETGHVRTLADPVQPSQRIVVITAG